MMRRVRSWAVVAVVVVVLSTQMEWLSRGWGGAQAAAAAPVPAESVGRERGGIAPAAEVPIRADVTFDAVIDRVRTATAPGAREHDWGEPAPWEALAGLVGRVKEATGRADLELPVEWPDVRKAAVGLPPQEAEAGTLYVCRGGSVRMARYAVILADGNLQIQHAEQCVIIARGAVLIIHGTGNVVLAGRHIEVAFDGDPGAGMRRPPPPPGGKAPPPRRNAPRPGGSLLISGGTIFVAHASDTVCSAPRAVRMSHPHSSTFLNSPNVPAAPPGNFPVGPGEQPEVMRSLQAGDLGPLVPRERPNPLEGKVKVTDVVSGGDRAFAVVEEGGEERVVRPGAELVPRGPAAPDAGGGWKLVAVGERFAVFSDGTDDAAFLLSER